MYYKDYKFVDEFAGEYIPFTQRATIRQHYASQAYCNGAVLHYLHIEKKHGQLALRRDIQQAGYSSNIASGNDNFLFAAFMKDIEQALFLQNKYKTQYRAIAYLTTCGYIVNHPTQANSLDNIINYIRNTNTDAIYMTGKCITTTSSSTGYDIKQGIHAFGFSFDDIEQSYTFFEANRGMVKFQAKEKLLDWFMKEAQQGELQVLHKEHNVFDNQTRRYSTFSIYGLQHQDKFELKAKL